MPRQDTLLNEIRNLLSNYTPEGRLIMFDLITANYCLSCGIEIPNGQICNCDADIGYDDLMKDSEVLN